MSKLSGAMRITLYGEDDEVKGEFTRSFVPWRLLKRAVRLANSMNSEEITEADMDNIAELVVEVFGGQFTLEQLNDGADVGEMMSVLNAIVAKVNPTMLVGNG